MEVLINICLINFTITWILGYSGFLFDFSKWLYEKLNKKKWSGQFIGKPFGCALCMTFWVTLIYCLFSFDILTALSIASLSGMLTAFTDKIIGVINKLISKI